MGRSLLAGGPVSSPASGTSAIAARRGGARGRALGEEGRQLIRRSVATDRRQGFATCETQPPAASQAAELLTASVEYEVPATYLDTRLEGGAGHQSLGEEGGASVPRTRLSSLILRAS